MNNNLCIFTDTHFGFKNNNENVLQSSLSFFTEMLIPFLKEHEIKKIFILGDLFDSRTSINTKVQNDIYNLFDVDLKEFDIYILLGNHDIYYNSSTDVHNLKFLYKFKNVTVIDKPRIIKTFNKNILMVPWLINDSELTNIINEFTNVDVLMGHFDIAGFSFNKFVLSKNGMSTNLFENKFKTVFSGHFHTRSCRKIGNTEFVYVGSPYQLTQADVNEERGFLIYNTRTKIHKFFSNDVSSKFVNIEYPEIVTKKQIEYNNVNIVIKYNEETYNPDVYNDYLSEIEEMNPIKLNPIYIDESDVKNDVDISESDFASIPQLMKSYVNNLKFNNEFHNDEVYNILIDVYKKVKGEYE